MRRTLGSLGLQALLLTLAVLGARRLDSIPADWREPFHLTPWLVLAVGLVLAWRFGRGRVLLALMLVAAFLLVLTAPLAGSDRLLGAAALLLPLNLCALTLVGERPPLSAASLTRVALVAVEAATVLWLTRSHPGLLERALSQDLLPVGFHGIPPLVLVAFTLALGVGVARLLSGRLHLEAGFVGALGACGLALVASGDEVARILYLTAAGLALLVATLEDAYGKAYVDELTGLPGRRALSERLEGLGRSYTIAMVDVDHFKRFNDRYGHDAGDQVLQMVAGRLSRVGGGGRSYRYGGEEFAIVFPGKRSGDTLPALEALREHIADKGFALRGRDRPRRKPRRKKPTGGGRRVKVTVSIGVAARSQSLPTARSVMVAADKALYRAKKKGRNRVCQ